MWVFTSFGLLMPAIRPPKYCPTYDDRKLQIRARRSKDLDILRAKFMPNSLGETIHTPSMDYEYRAYCTHEAWAVAMMRMSLEIDYTKFKPTTDRYKDSVYHSVLNRIWGVVISDLSSKKHQDDYWHSRGSDDWDWRPDRWRDSAADSKKAPGKAGTGWPDDPPMHSYRPSKGNGPEDVRPRSPLVSGGAASARDNGASDWNDCRQPKPSGYAAPAGYATTRSVGGNDAESDAWRGYLAPRYGYPEDSASATNGVVLEKYDSSVDRDETEPEVWDIPSSDITAGLSADALSDDDWKTLDALLNALPSTDDGATGDPLLEGMDIVTRARLEIADLTRSLGDRMTHADCDHGWSPNAKARCRRKHNHEVIKRIDEIEALIEDVKAERRRNVQPALAAG